MSHFARLVRRHFNLLLLGVVPSLTNAPCHAGEAAPAPSVGAGERRSPIQSSISLQGGVLSGTAREYVFSGGNKTSQLDWGMSPVIFAGLAIGTKFFELVFLNVAYRTGLNESVGNVTDSDFTSFGIPSLFSKQDSILERARFFDINAGYTYRIFKGLSVAGMLGYHRINFKMTARDGYVEYPPGSMQRPFYGTGIAVEQTYDIPYIGIEATYEIHDNVYAQLVPKYSPLVHCEERDYHFRRQLDVFSSMSSGQYASLIAALGWRINNSTSVVLSGEYASIAMAKGDSYSVDLTTGAKSPTASNSASVGFHATSVMLSVAHLLTWL
jgi:outer membrane protease